MKAAPFEYHRAETAAEAVALLEQLGDDAKILAGGQSLIPILALRLSAFEHLVDVSRVAEMSGIERRNGTLWVGASTTEAAVEAEPEVASAVPLLAQATPYIGHFQIRNRGTVGGSIAHADAAGEYPAVALALDAEFDVLSPSGPRTVPAADFFTGMWSTRLDSSDVLTGIRFPVWTGRCGFAVEEFARRHGDFAIAGAVVGVELDTADRVSRCCIGLIGLGFTPVRATAAEQAVVGGEARELDRDAIGRLAVDDLDSVPSDAHGPAAYRRRVGAVMVSRALSRAIEGASHG